MDPADAWHTRLLLSVSIGMVTTWSRHDNVQLTKWSKVVATCVVGCTAWRRAACGVRREVRLGVFEGLRLAALDEVGLEHHAQDAAAALPHLTPHLPRHPHLAFPPTPPSPSEARCTEARSCLGTIQPSSQPAAWATASACAASSRSLPSRDACARATTASKHRVIETIRMDRMTQKDSDIFRWTWTGLDRLR